MRRGLYTAHRTSDQFIFGEIGPMRIVTLVKTVKSGFHVLRSSHSNPRFNPNQIQKPTDQPKPEPSPATQSTATPRRHAHAHVPPRPEAMPGRRHSRTKPRSPHNPAQNSHHVRPRASGSPSATAPPSLTCQAEGVRPTSATAPPASVPRVAPWRPWCSRGSPGRPSCCRTRPDRRLTPG